jgi:hypothetical protein
MIYIFLPILGLTARALNPSRALPLWHAGPTRGLSPFPSSRRHAPPSRHARAPYWSRRPSLPRLAAPYPACRPLALPLPPIHSPLIN